MGKGFVEYYVSSSGENPIKEFLDSLNERQQRKLLRILSYIKSYGLESVIPHLKRLRGTPLWEIRILGADNIRVIYITFEEDTVLLLHGFVKKTQKTSPHEISLALQRLEEWIRQD